MALNALDTADVIEVMENFIDKKRPSEDIRHKLDLSYRIENQSIFIYEIRPLHGEPDRIIHTDFAKTTYGYLRKLFFDAKMIKYVRNQGVMRCPAVSRA